MNEPETSEFIALGIINLFNQKHFSICLIDKLIDLSKILPNPEWYKKWKILHCIDYMDMPQNILQWLKYSVLETFTVKNQLQP